MTKKDQDVGFEKSEKKTAVSKIETTYPIRRIPYVPSAVRNMPFTIHPVKK